MNYDQRHGGPFDRGSADAYYSRPFEPHYYVGATKMTPRISEQAMTAEEIEAYRAGYESTYERKDWGH